MSRVNLDYLDTTEIASSLLLLAMTGASLYKKASIYGFIACYPGFNIRCRVERCAEIQSGIFTVKHVMNLGSRSSMFPMPEISSSIRDMRRDAISLAMASSRELSIAKR